MELIDKSIVNEVEIFYYNGFDIRKILNHPSDGSKGLLVVFFDSIKSEEIKHNRNEIIISLLESKNINKFSDIINKLNNPFVILYQTHGYTNVVYKSIKNKIENIRDSNFYPKILNI